MLDNQSTIKTHLYIAIIYYTAVQPGFSLTGKKEGEFLNSFRESLHHGMTSLASSDVVMILASAHIQMPRASMDNRRSN